MDVAAGARVAAHVFAPIDVAEAETLLQLSTQVRQVDEELAGWAARLPKSDGPALDAAGAIDVLKDAKRVVASVDKRARQLAVEIGQHDFTRTAPQSGSGWFGDPAKDIAWGIDKLGEAPAQLDEWITEMSGKQPSTDELLRAVQRADGSTGPMQPVADAFSRRGVTRTYLGSAFDVMREEPRGLIRSAESLQGIARKDAIAAVGQRLRSLQAEGIEPDAQLREHLRELADRFQF